MSSSLADQSKNGRTPSTTCLDDIEKGLHYLNELNQHYEMVALGLKKPGNIPTNQQWEWGSAFTANRLSLTNKTHELSLLSHFLTTDPEQPYPPASDQMNT